MGRCTFFICAFFSVSLNEANTEASSASLSDDFSKMTSDQQIIPKSQKEATVIL